MNHLPTTRQIQFLLALRDHNSFHKAAGHCGVTQSTLSAAIQEMETILEAPLLDRANRKKLIFTPLGYEMLKRGKTIIEGLEEIQEQARKNNAPLSSPINIGIIPTIAPYLLPKVLKPLHKAFPKLALHLHEQQSANLVDAVKQGKLDAAIIAFPFDTFDLQRVSLFKEKFYCAAPKTLFSDKKKVTLADIEAQKLLLLADGHCLRDHALEACRLKSVKSQDVNTTSLSTLIQLVAQGYGVTLLPEMVVQEGHLPKTMHVLPIVTAPMREIGIIWRKNALMQQDIITLGLALYRLSHNRTINDDSFNFPN
jgi:LysR family hydrogen peroxide-inducible transcriptional activator